MSDINVVVDTHVFIRAVVPGAEHRQILVTILKVCHRIVVNTQIIKEYRQQSDGAGLSTELLQRILQDELPRRGKLRKTASKSGKRLLQGIPKQDQPFVEAARASQAAYLITQDHVLHDNRKKLARHGIRVVFPHEYVQANASSK